MTCKDCIHNEVCYKSESVSDNYAEKCGDCLTEKDLQRPQGEWIDTGSGQECSICKEIQYGYDSFRHFCPNCGADMRGKGDRE